MPTASNLYIEKIFAEQPNSIWALDEQVDYISLITEENRNLSTWTRSGATNTVTQYAGTDSPINSYSSQVAITTGTVITMTGTQFTSNYDSFAIGFYLQQYAGTLISKIEIGYSINGATAVYDSSYPAITTLSNWGFYSSTFKVTSGTTLIAPIIRITYSGSITFVTNGITIGCQSEEFNSSSLGQIKSTTLASAVPLYPGSLPSTTPPNIQYVIEAANYGLQKTSGYYIIDSQSSGDKLATKNSTMPMTYGANNSTIIYPHPQTSDSNIYPSIIIPGGGFLTEVNQHTDMTFECWFKINSLHVSNTTQPRRIFGPVATGNTDGLYVNGQFLVFKVGNLYDSYFVGEWFRPMLIQISIVSGGILIFINGTQVMQISYTSDNPASLLSTFLNGKDNRWLGFYAYSDIPNIEIDGVAIYPYASSEIISNRRYIYGQGVSYPINVDTAYGGETIVPDYSFSGYANAYSYPQIGKWKNGKQDNLNSQPSYIALNNYNLPKFNSSFGNTASFYDAWLKDLYTENSSTSDNYINLKPTSNTNLNKLNSSLSWSTGIAFLSLDSVSFLTSPTNLIYGVFKSPSSAPSSEQTLIKLYNYSTADYFKISFGTDRKVYYKYKIGNASEVTLTASTSSAVTLGASFSAGISLPIILSKYPELNSLLGNISQISALFGGDSLTVDSTFTGLIYQLSLSTESNYNKIPATSFDTTNGNVIYNETALKLHYPSYGVIAYKFVDTLTLDIKMNAYWEDNVPLSMLSTYVYDASGNKVYSLNSIQYNLTYPELSIFSSSSYDTSNALVKSYATFQYSANGANKPISNFTSTIPMPQNGEVIPLSTWATDRYEVVNNAILYPPSSISGSVTDLSIVLSLDFYVNGINANPIKINSLQLASTALNQTATEKPPTPINGIGTKFGKTIYPYSIVSGLMKYDQKNSIAIAKNSNEYLYLNKYNGIRLSGDTTSGNERGIKISVNEYNVSDFLIGSMQMSVLWTENTFPTTPRKILTIVGESLIYNLYIVSCNTSNTRGKIFVSPDGTTPDKSSINFYWNSILVENPIVSINEWGMLGISFNAKMSMFSANAYIGLLSTMLFTNISYYLIDSDKFSQQVVTNSWNQVASVYTTWTGIATKNWSQINFSSGSTSPSISPSTTYKSILGVNTTTIDSDQYSGKLLAQKYSYVSYPNFTTQSITSQPT